MIPPDPLRNLGPATILRADARTLPLADNSVDLIVTSPPYFALRSYQDAGEHYAGQLGSEATPAEFVDALIDCTREMVRVVKPSGSIFVNLGDKFAGGAGDKGGKGRSAEEHGYTYRKGKSDAANLQAADIKYDWGGVRPKSLMGIPWRYALRCIDDLGLILRAEIIWSKPNGLPESVTDRVRRSHEQWFHFTLEPRYYSAVDEIREEQATYTTASGTVRYRRPSDEVPTEGVPDTGHGIVGDVVQGKRSVAGVFVRGNSPLGKLPGSVWTIPTEPLRVPDHLGVDHFAAFPSEWPKRIIRGWSPAGVCTACGEGRRPVVERSTPAYRSNDSTEAADERDVSLSSALRIRGGGPVWNRLKAENPDRITGYTCPCDGDGYRTAAGLPLPPTVPAIVLDPFGGTGTVAMVARALGRHGIHADLSADYNRLAHWRITDLDQLAAVQGHQRTKRQPDDQPTLLDEIPEVSA